VPAPDFQSGEAGFQTRENALSCNYRALALVKMPQALQSTRTFLVTSTAIGRRATTVAQGPLPAALVSRMLKLKGLPARNALFFRSRSRTGNRGGHRAEE